MADPTVRVRLRYPDLDTFIERFAPNVTRGGIFLPTREQHAVGAPIGFELLLTGEKVAFAGQGKVVWVRAFDPTAPERPYGLGVQFTHMEPAARLVLQRLVDRRAANGRRVTMSVPVYGGVPASGDGRPATGGWAVEPAARNEFDTVEDSSVRRMVDRARLLSNRTDDLEALLHPEADEGRGPTVAQAVAELSRYLSNAARRGSVGTRATDDVASNAAVSTAVRGDGDDPDDNP